MGLFNISASPVTAFQSALTFTSAPVAIEFSFILSADDIAPDAVVVAVESESVCPVRLSPFPVPMLISPVFVPERLDDVNVPLVLTFVPSSESEPVTNALPFQRGTPLDAIVPTCGSVSDNAPGNAHSRCSGLARLDDNTWPALGGF